MRLHIASMALSLAFISRHARTASAFSLKPVATFSSAATKSSLGATVESDVNGATNLDDLFPLKGKDVMECPPRMRFAPSPTGSLHVGGARTALYNWLAAKKGQLDFPKENAGFILRVEDTDVARSTKESEASVLADLTWLGLTWDEGPDMEDAKFGPYRQSERGELYVKLATQLLEEGKAYKCFSTKEELEEMKAKQEAEGIPTRYDGTWRDADPELVQQKLDEGVEYTVRFKVPAGARIVIDDAVRGTVSWDAESTVGDFILLRSSGIPVYNFCVAVDDSTMGITTVVRAEEHLTNTLRQGLILDALGAPRPRYAHCSLILGEDKQKLSKRHGATSCDQFRLDGFLPDAMINYLALLGWNDGTDEEIFSRDELIEIFDVDRVVKSPSIFDMDKLKWINSQHMKKMAVEELTDLVGEQLQMMNFFKDASDEQKIEDFKFASTALAKQMMQTTQDAALNAKEVMGYSLPDSFEQMADGEAKQMIKQGNFYPVATMIVQHAEAGTMPLPDPSEPLASFLDGQKKAITEDNESGGEAYSFPEAYKAYTKSLSKELKVKGKGLFHPLRLALTAEMSGQDIPKQLSLLSMATGEDSVIDQVNAGVVSLDDRILRLKAFCETIPEEFRAAKIVEKKSNGASKQGEKKSNSESAAVSATSTTADPIDSYEGPAITSLDIKVGRITKVWEHPEADKLYCEEIDVGEDEPRLIASGLKPFMKAEDMEGRKVLVLCNLKARKMLGFASHGMVLCASNEDHTDVKFVSPPIDAEIGERVTVPGFNFEGEAGAPMKENPMGKKKIFDKLAPFLVTSKYGVPEFLGRPFMTSAGVCTSPISDGNVA
jgi:glutamyl-tRNA synthetase